MTDETPRTGQHGEYYYLVAEAGSLGTLAAATIECHAGLSLVVTAFDGGSGTAQSWWRAAGWEQAGWAMIHRSVARGFQSIGSYLDQSNEWYLFDGSPPPDCCHEVFVNQGFTPVPVAKLYRDQDPTWDWRGWDYLLPIQERFWEQVEGIRPVSYVATGDQVVIVSRRFDFIERLRSEAR